MRTWWLVAGVAWCVGCGGGSGGSPAAPGAPGNGTRTPSGAGVAATCPSTPARIADAFSVAAKDDAFLYGFGAGALERLPKSGGAAETVLSGLDTAAARSLAIDERDAFWISDGTPGRILRAPKAGGNVFDLAISARPATLVLDATHVYWVDADGGAVALVSKHDDLRAQSVLVAGAPGVSGAALVVDDAFVYHAISYVDAGRAQVYAVHQVPLAGGADVELARVPANIVLLAGGGAALVAATDGGMMVRIDKASGAQLAWRAPDATVDALALDGDRVYVASHDASGAGHLARAAQDGSALTILAAERVTTPLVLDGDSVYFNAIERVCK